MAEVDNHQLLSRAFAHEKCEAKAPATVFKKCGSMNDNNDSNANVTKRYLVYMELPKIKIGDYHKSSCVVGNILRFHFLLKINANEKETLRLLPIKAYRVPVVNVAVIHRPLLDDDIAKGPIPKSPAIKSPLIRYSTDERDEKPTESRDESSLEDDFRKDSAVRKQQEEEEEKQREYELQQKERRDSEIKRQKEIELLQQRQQQQKQEQEQQQRQQQREEEAKRQREDEAKRQREEEDERLRQHKRSSKKRKKYFVYCELPKVAVGDYRISSVTSSELIHCHFLIKIAKDEVSGQPQLRPIKKYKRPRVNFAVIHRSLIVDNEAAGPIPRSPGVKSPMIREDMDDGDDSEVLHATMGFKYGGAPVRSKYELVSQWSLVADERGRVVPQLVLSKALG